MSKNQYDISFRPTVMRVLMAVCLASSAVGAAENPPAATSVSKPIAIISAPEGTAGHFLSSRYAQRIGDVDAAILFLTKALEKTPDNLDLAAQLLSAHIAKGDMKTAERLALQLRSAGERDPLGELTHIATLIKDEDYKTARTLLAQSFDEAAGQLWLPLFEAWTEVGNQHIKQPLSMEQMPVAVGRAATMMHYHLALINAYAGFNEQAAAEFLEALDGNETPAPRMLQQAKSFLERNPKAELLAQFVARTTATHPDIGLSLESTIRSPAEGVAEVLFSMGSVMQMAGVRHDATVYYQLARYLRPDFHLATLSLAELFIDGEAYERASSLLASIPDNSQYALKASLRRASMLDRMGQTAEATKLLTSLTERNPKNPDPWIAKGDMLRVHERFLEASIAYSEALTRLESKSNKRWALLYARGACYERLDRWNDAKQDLRAALADNPEQPDVLNYLGYSLITRGESAKEAKEMLERAISANPNDPQVIDSMGWALYTLGSYQEALPFLERAVEMLPNDATVNDHLGDLYWRLGRKHEARFQWKRALNYGEGELDAEALNKKLAAGLPMAEPRKPTHAAAASAEPAAIP